MNSGQSMVVWLKRVGVTLAAVIGVVFLWRGLLAFAAAIAMAACGIYLGDRWRKWRAVRRFRACWRSQGKDLLLVYRTVPTGGDILRRPGSRSGSIGRSC